MASGGVLMHQLNLGGMKVPASVRWAIAEMVLGSNPAIHIYASGYAFAQVAYVSWNRCAEEDGKAHGRKPLGCNDAVDRT